jgi:hypothetical protein
MVGETAGILNIMENTAKNYGLDMIYLVLIVF